MPSKIITGGCADCVPIEWQERRDPGVRVSEVSPRDLSPGPAAPLPTSLPASSESAEAPQELLDSLRQQLEQQAEASIRTRLEQQFQAQLAPTLEAARREAAAAAQETARAELETKFDEAARAIAAAAAARSKLRHEAERDVVGLALAIARRVLRRQVLVDEESLLGLVKAALENVSLREVTEVRLHPQFASRVDAFLRQSGAPASIRVTGDGSLEAGAVLVESSRGSFDASLEVQLDEIGRGLTDLLAAPPRRLP